MYRVILYFNINLIYEYQVKIVLMKKENETIFLFSNINHLFNHSE